MTDFLLYYDSFVKPARLTDGTCIICGNSQRNISRLGNFLAQFSGGMSFHVCIACRAYWLNVAYCL